MNLEMNGCLDIMDTGKRSALHGIFMEEYQDRLNKALSGLTPLNVHSCIHEKVISVRL